MIEFNINDDVILTVHTLHIWDENDTSPLWSFSSKSQPSHEKNRRQIPVEGHSTEDVTIAPLKCQDRQNQGKSKKLSQPRCKETWQQNIITTTTTAKGIPEQKKDIWEKLRKSEQGIDFIFINVGSLTVKIMPYICKVLVRGETGWGIYGNSTIFTTFL